MLDNSRVIEILKARSKFVADINIDAQIAYKKAIESLEKQIPKKVLEVKAKHDFNGNVIYKDGYCPICKNELSSSYIFCNGCGQKLDWD